jgi:hypothetical protein
MQRVIRLITDDRHGATSASSQTTLTTNNATCQPTHTQQKKQNRNTQNATANRYQIVFSQNITHMSTAFYIKY